MNVQQILEEVGDELQHAPDVRAAFRDRHNVLRRVHTDLCLRKRWPWMYRQFPLHVYPDIITDSTVWAMEIGTSSTSERVLVTDTEELYDAGLGDLANEVTEREQIDAALLDATLGVVDATLGTTTGWDAGPFLVDAAVDVKARLPGAPGEAIGIFLEPRAAVSLAGTEGNLVFTWPRRRLQSDVEQLVEILLEDGRRLTPVSPGEFEQVSRANVAAGTPAIYTSDSPVLPPFAPASAHIDAIAAADSSPNRDAYSHRNRPIRDQIGAAFIAGTTSDFEVSRIYRVFCCYMYQGRFGPPSNTVEVSTSNAANRQLQVSNLPEFPPGIDATYPDIGWTIAFFVATDDGPFYMWNAAEQANLPYVGGPSRTFNLNAMQYRSEPWKHVRWDEEYPGGQYRYIRIWPKPTARTRLIVRYRAKPPSLVGRTDEPWFDDSFHDYLVAETVAQLMGRATSDVLWRRMQSRANLALARMTAFYLPDEATRYQKGRIDVNLERRVPPITVNWQG